MRTLFIPGNGQLPGASITLDTNGRDVFVPQIGEVSEEVSAGGATPGQEFPSVFVVVS
jgi:hypothetical protein